MSSSFFYPLSLLFNIFPYLDTALLWGLLIFSAALNIYLLNRNKKLNSQLERQQQIRHGKSSIRREQYVQQDTPDDAQAAFSDDNARANISPAGNLPEKNEAIKITQILPSSSLAELEAELDNSIWLDDNEVKSTPELIQSEQAIQDTPMQKILQSLSGWHHSLVPFLLQNIGWFIGILCFISGSVFFISYTEGFTKSVTIFYIILSYTLLLAWAGYRLKEKVAHASISGNVLMAISLLLIPLNFSAAAQLIDNSLANSMASAQYIVAIVSTMISLVALFYITKLISGVFNRQLLAYFPAIFFALSTIQLIVPVLQNSQSMVLLLLLQTVIMSLLLIALISYLPSLLKQIFVDRKYMTMLSVGALIYAALVSTVHITLSSPLTIALSYYAPILMLISGALFYMDGQLNEYKSRHALLSYFSFITYAVSFAAIFLSFDSELSRVITLLLGSIIYARLVWIYRSLIPLYLVISLLCFLHFDLFLFNTELSATGFNITLGNQWYYLTSLPLLALFSAALIFLRKSETQRERHFDLTRHLFHFILLASCSLSVFSQLFITTGSMAVINGMVVIISCFYLLNSKRIKADQLLAEKISSGYFYLLLLLPIILILLSSEAIIFIDIKLALMAIIALFYSLNSRFNFMPLAYMESNSKHLKQEMFINSSLLITLLLLVLVGIAFTLSLKIAALLLILSLNCLFLSMTLYNRALFYVFIVIASLSVLIVKLYLSHSPSTGLLTISSVFILFYLLHYLDRKRNDDLEAIKADMTHQQRPEKIFWFYPSDDFTVKLASRKTQEIENV